MTTQVEPATPPRKAGRNLPAAIGTGLAMGGVFLASVLLVKEAFVVLTAVAVVASVWELANALGTRRHVVPRIPLVVGTAIALPAAYVGGSLALLAAVAGTAAAVVVWRLAAPGEHRDDATLVLRDVTSGVLVVLWLPLLAGFAMLLLREDDGAGRVFVFVSLSVASDVGGYVVGALFGRHKLAPTVSPKKSWEGLAGSVGACLATGVAGVVLVLGGPWWAGLAVGGAAVVTATLGDLVESVLKRDLGIKDMGTLIPGHGGVLDRLDSMLLNAPVVWLLLAVLVPVAG